MLETTEPFGIIVAPHNHDIEVRSADNLINSLVNFYDRIRHRVYGALGISSIMMGETG
jgi:ASC-1-like (ASCH) protein